VSSVSAADVQLIAAVGRGETPSILHLVRPATLLEKPALGLGRRRWSMGSDAGVMACRAVVAATPQLEHKVIVIGGGAAGARVAELGLAATARMAPPMGRAEMAGPALTRWIKAYGSPRVVQGWGAEFGGLRGRTGAARVSWCVADMEQGVLEARLEQWPPVTSAMTPWLGGDGAGAAVRGSGGEKGVWRVALLGDPPGAMDSLAFVYSLTILHVAGIRATAVIPKGAGRLDRTLRHIAGGGYLHRVELLEGSVMAALGGCDLAICVPLIGDEVSASEPSFATKLCVGAACAAGLPVIMKDCPWAKELLPEGAHVCLSPTLEPARLARVACAMLTGPGLDQARAALRAGVRAPGRSAVTEVVQAWGISALAGAGR
jgi:hypothetical protein